MRDVVPDLGRREVVQRLAMSLGGIVAFPLVAAAHPIQQHLRDHVLVGAADAKASAQDYAPEFLDRHQLDTLALLAERIVPGSTDARSAPFIDQLLNVATIDERRRFLQGLGAFEGLAITRARSSWKQMTGDQQDELLTFASTTAPRNPPEAGARESAPPTIRDHFEELKGWIVGAYYSSEIGMRELGWNGTVFFPAFPGCDHPDSHR